MTPEERYRAAIDSWIDVLIEGALQLETYGQAIDNLKTEQGRKINALGRSEMDTVMQFTVNHIYSTAINHIYKLMKEQEIK